MQDDPRNGQPKTQRKDANADRVRTLVCSDRRLSVRVIAEEFNMNRETVQQIVKEDLGMREISTKMNRETVRQIVKEDLGMREISTKMVP